MARAQPLRGLLPRACSAAARLRCQHRNARRRCVAHEQAAEAPQRSLSPLRVRLGASCTWSCRARAPAARSRWTRRTCCIGKNMATQVRGRRLFLMCCALQAPCALSVRRPGSGRAGAGGARRPRRGVLPRARALLRPNTCVPQAALVALTLRFAMMTRSLPRRLPHRAAGPARQRPLRAAGLPRRKQHRRAGKLPCRPLFATFIKR